MTELSQPQKISRLSPKPLSDTERWQAIATRDITANTFVYAVLTTRIYCRPSCPARLARRANIQFYDGASQAEKAGFRACKRCRPHSGQTAAQSNPQTAIIEHACVSIRNILTTGLKPKLRDLAAQAHLTPSHFHRVFKKHVGVTPGQYIDSLAQSNLHSLGSVASDAFPGVETSCSGSEGRSGEIPDLEKVSEKAGPSVAGSLGDMGAWNEFDALLASEQEHPWRPDLISIDPLILVNDPYSVLDATIR